MTPELSFPISYFQSSSSEQPQPPTYFTHIVDTAWSHKHNDSDMSNKIYLKIISNPEHDRDDHKVCLQSQMSIVSSLLSACRHWMVNEESLSPVNSFAQEIISSISHISSSDPVDVKARIPPGACQTGWSGQDVLKLIILISVCCEQCKARGRL